MKRTIERIIAWALKLRTVRAFLIYSENRGAMLADSVTYRALFSIFAGVLLGFSFAALWLGGNPDAMAALTNGLDQAVPGLTDLINPDSIDAPTGLTITGIISLGGLLVAALGAVKSLREAISVLHSAPQQQTNAALQMVANLLLAILLGGLLLVSAGVGMLGSVAATEVGQWLSTDSGTGVRVATRVVTVATSLAVNTVAIVLMVKLLSRVQAPRRGLWGGALFGGVGLLILQEFSALFVRGATSNPLLATFAALIALLLWVNLSVQVILVAISMIIMAEEEAHDRVRTVHGASTLQEWKQLRAENRVQVLSIELQHLRESEQNSQR